MIETQINITVNRKADIDIIKSILIRNKIEFPIYLTEFGEYFGINFTSNYEEWELDKMISDAFPGYEFTTDLHLGRKEIRLEISRHQSELCTTDWGNPIDNPLNETKYLIKKGLEVPIQFNPAIKVLFGPDEQTYHINIIPGINNSTQEKGFLLVDEFKHETDPETADFFPDKLYKTQLDAFYRGKHKLENIVNRDFKDYLEVKKKEKQQREKIPRKIVREFVKACNNFDKESILKDLSENLSFEIKINWKQKLITDGLEEFKNYIDSSYQEICGRDFKIKSSWSFIEKDIKISLETFTPPSEPEEAAKSFYRIRLNIRLDEGKITQIILEK
ncbi:hypothetical protein ACVVIH_22315 [Chryseobacterium arthrosphaerae]|uniref:hypothetical protein n=1 Tax=Chryseobacterium arthrosphaerae TaxID=651561 RepID=UPI003D32DB8E